MLMSNLAFSPALEGGFVARSEITAVRTLLVGEFEQQNGCNRLMLEAMLTKSPDQVCGNPAGCSDLDPVEHAETQLAHGAVDIVLLDLDGPVGVILSLVGRLRAAAGERVVFIGILPWHVDDRARLYLSAVVDEVIDEPLRPTSVWRVVAEALRAASGFTGIFFCGPVSIGTTTRH